VNADVVVIGAGCAGLSAAVRLAAAGLSVVVFEESPRLGGRATSFTDRETGERVDNGQHVLFGCYRETYAYLKQIGAADLAPLQQRLSLSIAGDDGRQTTLTCRDWPPPWHLVSGLFGWSALGWRDRLSALRLAPLLQRVRRLGPARVAADVPASQTTTAWLRAHGQSDRLRTWLWNPLAIAALNQSPDVAAAQPFVRVLGELFGPRADDSAIGLPTVPLDDLLAEPARRFVEERGGAVRTKSPARIRVSDGAIAGVRAGETFVPCSAVVCAVPWHAFDRVWEDRAPVLVADLATNAAATGSSPIVTVNLWFDGPVMTQPFIGLIGGPMQWVFDKSALFGTNAGHLSVVSSGAEDIVSLGNPEITATAVKQLAAALPATRGRRLTRSVVVREHRATFSLVPGGPPRPSNSTRLPGFYLAGDWTDTELPATIESAVLSGRRAADLVLAARRA